MSGRQYSSLDRFCVYFVLAAISGCGHPDPRTVAGAIEAAASSIEAGDRERLYWCIDQRARGALASVAQDRQRAAALIRADFPSEEQAAALAALGDAPAARDGAELFALRCGAPCLAELGSSLGTPKHQTESGPEVVVETVQGRKLRLYRGRDGRYGLVWRTAELVEERLRANRELGQIVQNAQVHRRRRALEASRPP